MTPLYFGLGSNQQAEKRLHDGLCWLSETFSPLAVSACYRSKAVGFKGDDFLNLVVEVVTDRDLLSVVALIKDYERVNGKPMGAIKWSDRTIDIDLLAYGNRSLHQPLRLPRVDVLKYAHVLRPFSELAPNWQHPVTGQTLAQHWRQFKLGDQALWLADWQWSATFCRPSECLP